MTTLLLCCYSAKGRGPFDICATSAPFYHASILECRNCCSHAMALLAGCVLSSSGWCGAASRVQRPVVSVVAPKLSL